MAVVTDSAADLPADLAAAHGIAVVPLDVRLGTELLRGVDAAGFWRRAAAVAEPAATSAPSPGAFREAFLAAAAGGARGVLCLTLSAELSATHQAALAGAAEVSSEVAVEVVDSRTATMGQGLLALEAAALAAGGYPLERCAAGVRAAIGRTAVFGTLDSLDELRRGGRIGGAQALVGSLLAIKPVIEVRGGRVEPESRQRTRARSLAYLVEKLRGLGPLQRLAVVHADASDLDQLLALCAPVFPPADTVVTFIGPVIGAHTGRGTVGLCALRQ